MNEPVAVSGVLYDVKDGIATITLNRPQKLNAVDSAARTLLFDAWRQFELDPAAKVAILTGAGERAFCVGRDLSEPADGNFRIESFPVLGVSVEVSKPTIAAVNGLALGGGFLFAQMCDMCIAAQSASFAIPEAKLGRGAAWAVPLMHQLPTRVAMEMLVTGAPLGAERLYQLGFVNAVVPDPELASYARRFASLVVANAPLSVRACRAMVRQVALEGARLSLKEAEAMFEHVYASNDAREGVAAFRERRAPRWTGT